MLLYKGCESHDLLNCYWKVTQINASEVGSERDPDLELDDSTVD